ncbi:hypothetical protein CIK97_01515 [Prevotella sp. P3-120]|uniref:BACON domain-containing protein n=1 Tax=unclassified Prevotella TaxID=2638335 RepID=UPI000B962005|nr:MULTISPECIES: BACON domain-containing carbohydrate-binding protein [unclassified Prevotella]OYP50224.1 hypothetical protein CIK93_08975 [Prevotella sp. P3-92]OYP52168.1 hypothetical protein CIK97_01515 [Prevotella sp. P3-120]
MKKIYSLIVFAIGSLTLASCGDDDFTEKVNTIQVEKSETTIPAAGGSVDITLTGEGLTVASAADWLTATINGNVLTASATANPTRESRASHIDVKAANGDTYLVSIVQTGGMLALESNELAATDLDASYNVAIAKAVGSVTVKSLSDWVKASVNAKSDSIKVEVASNDYAVARQGKILVTSGVLEDTLFVNQAAMKFSLSTNVASILSNAAGSKTVTVSHSKPVTVESKADWITASITGNVIKVSVAANATKRRVGEVAVKSGKSEKTLYVSQLDFADQFPGTYKFLFYDVEKEGWYYLPALVTDKGIIIKPFTNFGAYTIPLTVNKTARTVQTANCGTYLGEWGAGGTTLYLYLAWGNSFGGDHMIWSTATVTDAASTGTVYAKKQKSGDVVTIIDWAGTWTYNNVTHQIDTWLFQVMKANAFTTANNLGSLLAFGKPYLMSNPEGNTAKYANKNGCAIQLPNGEYARPAVLKNILRPLK